MGVWHTAEEVEIEANDGNKYTSGFHIFLSREEAKKYGSDNLIKVSFKEAHTIGDQGGAVVIARKIKFEKVIERYNEKLQKWVKVKKCA